MIKQIQKYLLPLFLLNVGFAAEQKSLSPEWLDQSISPKDNFYLFATGGWIKNNPIPKSEAEWSVFNILDRKIDKQLQSMLIDLPNNPTKYQQKINQELYRFYQSGMNTEAIEQANFQPLLPLISQINAIRNQTDIIKVVSQLHELGIGVFFSFSEFPSFHKKQFYISQINQCQFILPDRSYYLKKDAKNNQILQVYKNLLIQNFKNIHYTEEESIKAAQDVLDIETQLAQFALPQDYFREPKNIDHISSIQNINDTFENLQFNTYLKELGLTHIMDTNVSVPEYFKQLNQYLPKLSLNQIKHYLIASLLASTSNQLNMAFQKPYCELSKAIRGNQDCPKRWLTVIRELNGVLGFAMGDLYVATYAKPGEVNYITNMVNLIKDQLKQKLMDSTWLSQSTRVKALQKLNHMRYRIGYPKPLDYSKLNINSDIYVVNDLAAAKFYIRRGLDKIGKPINQEEWDMTPQSVNAYYDVTQNRINIPLGILQEPFYSSGAPDSFNFGGIGVVIGHELFHGFDDMGAQFDADGIYQNWWSPSEWKLYQDKVNCIATQFSNYTVPTTDIKVNGKLVSGEAIADLGGITLSFDAYHHSKYFKQNKSIDGFTPEQQFFIRFAQIWASNSSSAELKRRGIIDPHPPRIYRTNGTLINVPAFYEAFHLKMPNSNMCTLF
jgi:putative endopeptidase